MSKLKRKDYLTKKLGIKLKRYDLKEFEKCIITGSVIRTFCRLTNNTFPVAYELLSDEMIFEKVESINYSSVISNVLCNSFKYKLLEFKNSITLGEFIDRYCLERGRFAIVVQTKEECHMFPIINNTWYDEDKILNIADEFLAGDVLCIIVDSISYNKFYKFLLRGGKIE